MMNVSSATAALRPVAVVLALWLGASGALAHTHVHTHARTAGAKAGRSASVEEHPFGKAGNPRKVTRSITVEMNDDMRFTPSRITVRKGETIRFLVRNKGKMLHEMVLGTMEELKEHAEMMKKHPEMEHDEPYMSHVDSGKRGSMVWQFTKAGEFFFACLVPGHYDAGMWGKIIVTNK